LKNGKGAVSVQLAINLLPPLVITKNRIPTLDGLLDFDWPTPTRRIYKKVGIAELGNPIPLPIEKSKGSVSVQFSHEIKSLRINKEQNTNTTQILSFLSLAGLRNAQKRRNKPN
jgi:hypothetical protein